jgi:hypothetical protein
LAGDLGTASLTKRSCQESAGASHDEQTASSFLQRGEMRDERQLDLLAKFRKIRQEGNHAPVITLVELFEDQAGK